ATPADWATLREVIEELDIRRPQVFVEAIILEATLDNMRALGVEFRATAQHDGGVGLAQTNLNPLTSALTDPTSLAGLVLAAASNQKVRLPNGQEVPAQTALLTALQNDTTVNVLSAPNLITTDNEEAEIVVGRNVPFVASRATSASNLQNLFTTIVRQDVGITLRLTPQITADDFVRLNLFEEVSDIVPTVDAGDPNQVGPTTTIRSASTEVAAHDGQTVVIGGLLSDTVRGARRRPPARRPDVRRGAGRGRARGRRGVRAGPRGGRRSPLCTRPARVAGARAPRRAPDALRAASPRAAARAGGRPARRRGRQPGRPRPARRPPLSLPGAPPPAGRPGSGAARRDHARLRCGCLISKRRDGGDGGGRRRPRASRGRRSPACALRWISRPPRSGRRGPGHPARERAPLRGGEGRRERHPPRTLRAHDRRALPHRRYPPRRPRPARPRARHPGRAREDHGRARHRRASPPAGRSHPA